MLGLLAPSSPFHPPTTLYAFLSSPITFAARLIYNFFGWFRSCPAAQARPIRIVCISDTHTQKKTVPDGDLLIHAGDLTNDGTVLDIQDQIDWLHSLPHPHKVVIAGNHDTYMDPRSRRTLSEAGKSGKLDWRSLNYLQHSSVTLTFSRHQNRRLKIYGAPQIPACGGPEHAFQYIRHQDGWSNTVPRDIDVLVTHTPPRWHLDLPPGLGCEWLLKEVWKVRPRLHVFGHIHGNPGRQPIFWDDGQAAYERICDRSYGRYWTILHPFTWTDFGVLLFSGLQNLAWHMLWGGRSRGSIMVNAAQIWDATGNLDSEPKVVEI